MTQLLPCPCCGSQARLNDYNAMPGSMQVDDKEYAAVLKDALRYRWLRKLFPALKAWHNDSSVDFIDVDRNARFTKYDPATLDAAIDKALKETP